MQSKTGLCWLSIFFVTSGFAAAAEPSLADRIKPLVEAHRGETAVAVKHLRTAESFELKADEPMPTASLIKFPVMVEAYRQAAEGQIDLKEMLTLRDAEKAPGSGILSSHFSDGASFSLRDAIRLMIAYSDNTATNLVLQKISLPATNDTMEKLGLANTKVHGLVFRPQSSILPERSKQFGLGSTTAAEMIKLLELLEAGKVVNAAACDDMLEHLRACQDKNRIPKLLPAGTKVAHKTGSVGSVRTAAGIIEAPSGPIALCVLTRNNEDQRWTDDNAAELLTAQIARAVYDHFETGRPQTSPDGLLKLGSTGRLVETLQRTLNARLDPSPGLAIDGDFGPLTEASVKAFQKSKNLRATGEVLPETWKALEPLVETEAK
jgi:beta-lactamase class A